MLEFTKKEINSLKKLNTPAKIQDFLDSYKFNFEEKGETIKSPVISFRGDRIHCFEGALLGAFILSLNGHKPLILHLKAEKGDFDHMIALFQINKSWGALSKTNHYTLRYREPVYKNIRELVMSYFHEYFLNKNGKKTLRSYSEVLNLNIFKKDWIYDKEDLWYIDEHIDKLKHYEIAPKEIIIKYRKVDKIEIKAGELIEYKGNKKIL